MRDTIIEMPATPHTRCLYTTHTHTHISGVPLSSGFPQAAGRGACGVSLCWVMDDTVFSGEIGRRPLEATSLTRLQRGVLPHTASPCQGGGWQAPDPQKHPLTVLRRWCFASAGGCPMLPNLLPEVTYSSARGCDERLPEVGGRCDTRARAHTHAVQI